MVQVLVGELTFELILRGRGSGFSFLIQFDKGEKVSGEAAGTVAQT
jgi:hypothetical protein